MSARQGERCARRAGSAPAAVLALSRAKRRGKQPVLVHHLRGRHDRRVIVARSAARSPAANVTASGAAMAPGTRRVALRIGLVLTAAVVGILVWASVAGARSSRARAPSAAAGGVLRA